MRWVESVARMGREEVHKWFWLGNLRDRVNLDDLVADGRIMFKVGCKEIGWECDWLTIMTTDKPFEHGSEYSVSIQWE
jgi:hypothetical protein